MAARLGPDDRPQPGDTADNKSGAIAGVPIPGRVFTGK
jgi:hypothetical protein